MEIAKDACCEVTTGIGAALITVLFCGIPLALVGGGLARLTARTAPAPMPDALHASARFAIAFLTLNACLIVPLTIVLPFVPEGRESWPVLLFLGMSCLADAVGLRSWLTVLRHTANSRVSGIGDRPHGLMSS